MSALTQHKHLPAILIGLIAALVFIPFIGNCPLFDWDEVNFAECAREMISTGDYSQVQLNFRPFWEKPPFFIWLQALSMHLFGINEFAARFPNAVCSIASLIAIYYIGRQFHSSKFGLLWSSLYAATLLPHLYFKSGLIDPWFNLFIFLSVYSCIRFMNNPRGARELLHAFFAGLFLGLAVLTKGPAALVIVALTLTSLVIWQKRWTLLVSRSFLLFVFTTLLVAGSWFLVEWLSGNARVISEFITYQVRLFETGDSGHDGPFVYHFVVLLLGCFPASLLFMVSYLKYKNLTPYQRLFRKAMVCLFWVVLILFSVVKTKIVHYSSLCYFPLTFVATIGLTDYFQKIKFHPVLAWLYWIIAAVFTIAFTIIGFINYLKPLLISSGLIGDPFAVQNLQANVHWSGFESLLGPLFLLSAIFIYRSFGRKKIKWLYYGLTLQLVFIWLAIAIIIPKVELYSQQAAISFYRQCARHNCYVETHGFKSYAYLFYSNRSKNDYTNPDQKIYIKNQLDLMETEGHSRFSSFSTANMLWMENGLLDRPAYIVMKTKDESNLLSRPDFKKLYSENGFTFCVRTPQSSRMSLTAQ